MGEQMIMCVDPAWSKDFAYAKFSPTGNLQAAGLVSKEEFEVGDDIDLVIIEEPQIYANAIVNPNSILKVGMGVGWAAGVASLDGAKIEYIKPHAWKGNLDKDKMSELIESQLTPMEKGWVSWPKAKGKRGDVLDAIGIGLHHFKRIGQPKIYRGTKT